ncbi:MAG: phenylalanine 4-monooxygenase [Xanthomonadaceae bacterium]|nr:phenylalanine 4-monooxygenase [Xanthomonadaceae bacterium]
MGKGTKYVAKTPDADGYISYTDDEHAVWNHLITRQRPIAEQYACDEYLVALERMKFPTDRIPQCNEVSDILHAHTGWQVAPVAALIPFGEFFRLLSEKKFPAASFIRSWEELDYLQEPDIFHEIFGHTPLLTDPRFAEFTHAYGLAGLQAPKEDRAMLARLYWFTVEFGLMNTAKGLKTYGAGIVSSIGETPYSIESDVPLRKPFDPVEALRTPYRIDIFQTVYFTIESLDELFKVAQMDLFALIAEARRLGMHTPTFPIDENAPKWA